MRVAFVIERFEPRGGGMEAVAWTVAHGLAAAGDEVHVVARTAHSSDTVQVHRVPVVASWQPLRVLSFSRHAGRAARTGFDVVHGFSRTLEQDVYRAGGGSHADYMRRTYGTAGAIVRRWTPRHAVLLAIERRIFADPGARIQCASRMVRDEIRSRFRVPDERLHVIPNGVDCERFRPTSSGRRVPLDGAVGGDDPVWLFAGSGWRRKGLDTALAALARSAPSAARLRVVGRDDPRPWRSLARRLGVDDRVDFLGDREDMEDVYRSADALLLPTRYDAFANVCLEAAACGLPVVTSGANGSGELLGRGGIVVPDPEDIAGFARALDRLSEAHTRREMGRSARTMAREHTWEKHVERLQGLYRAICGERVAACREPRLARSVPQ